MNKREQILAALRAHIESRPEIEPGNYADWKSYRSESRAVTADLHDARTLLQAVRWRESIDEAALRAAFKRAHSGRLAVIEDDKGRMDINYCAGQYYPTEYRKAACAVLAYALWYYTRDHAMPEPQRAPEGAPEWSDGPLYDGVNVGTWLRQHFRREFGRRIQERYFS